MKTEQFLETSDLIKALGVCQNTIYLWIKKGLPFYRAPQGRYHFSLPDVQAWMKATPRHVGRPRKESKRRATA